MKDYYKILEIAHDTSQEAVKEQYRFLVQAWHPDKFPNPTQKIKAEERIKEINAAYVILGNPAKRTEYDRHAGYIESSHKHESSQSTTQSQAEDERRREDEVAQHVKESRWKKRRETIDREEDVQGQKVSQLDQEISLIREEISKISKELPKLPTSIFAISLSLGSFIIFLIAYIVDITFLYFIGAFSLITGIYLFNERAKFYKKNYKPIFDEVEKRKRRLEQLVQERRYLLSVI